MQIPLEAKCETLGFWTMRHPAPHLLELDFDVPTPTAKNLSLAKWFWRALFIFWIVLASVVLPRLDIFALSMLVPVITAFFLLNQTPQVQRISVDSKERIVRITDLRAGKSIQRTIPFLEVRGIRYAPGHSSSTTSRPAAIWIDAQAPYESVCLSRIGILQHEQLISWLQSMVGLRSESQPWRSQV